MSRLAVCCSFWLALAGSARANEKLDVAVVVVPEADVFSSRLSAELRAVGLRTRLVGATAASLETIARDSGAQAATRVLPSGLGLEIWLDERATGRPMLRHLVVDERPGGPDVTMVVLQTTELLRSGLSAVPPSPPPSVEGTQEDPEPPPPQAEKLGVSTGLGLGVGAQAGGFGAVAVGRWEAAWSLTRALGVEALVQWPWQAADISGPEGRTLARGHRFALGLRAQKARGAWFLDAAVGASLEWWRVEGVVGQAGLVGSAHDATRAAGYGRVRTGWVAKDWLRFGVDGLLALSSGSIAVVQAERTAGRAGVLGAAALVTVEVSPP